jgi:hypothetical protein
MKNSPMPLNEMQEAIGERDLDRERETDRQTERVTERDRDRQKHRERELTIKIPSNAGLPN